MQRGAVQEVQAVPGPVVSRPTSRIPVFLNDSMLKPLGGRDPFALFVRAFMAVAFLVGGIHFFEFV